MRKLNLVIADSDENYINSLENYLMVHYSKRFDVYTFTTSEYLTAFLDSNEKRTDILLYCPHIFSVPVSLQKTVVSIAFVDNILSGTLDNSTSVYKFQHTEKLISDILRIYSNNGGDNIIFSGQKNTLTAAVFSSAGGAGKSSIAVGCSVMCARRGMKVFYLNLENVPSTTLYFKGNAEENFSNIIYYLKDRKHNLSMMLEGARSVDPDSKVNYFLPPDNILDMQELEPDELERLIRQIQTSAQYDAVFIDMAGGLSLLNSVVLKICDAIIQVCQPGEISSCKNISMASGLDILERKYSIDLTGKIVTVLNKFKTGYYCRDEENISSVFQVIINECEGFEHLTYAAQLMDISEFSAGINRLLEKVIPQWNKNKRKDLC